MAMEHSRSALYRSFARAGVRSVRRRVRDRRRVRPVQRFVPARVSDYELRLLRPTDAAGWTGSMRANEERMRPWWPEVGDWAKATDNIAFADHYLQWRARTRAGSGFCAVFAGPKGVLGEVTTWNLTPGAVTGEAGVWLYPKISRRHFLPLWAAYFDNCMGNLGLLRMTAPVAVGNQGPIRLVTLVGARQVATLPGYAVIEGELRDHDVYSVSREEWVTARAELYARYPWPTVTEQLPDLAAGGVTVAD